MFLKSKVSNSTMIHDPIDYPLECTYCSIPGGEG